MKKITTRLLVVGFIASFMLIGSLSRVIEGATTEPQAYTLDELARIGDFEQIPNRHIILSDYVIDEDDRWRRGKGARAEYFTPLKGKTTLNNLSTIIVVVVGDDDFARPISSQGLLVEAAKTSRFDALTFEGADRSNIWLLQSGKTIPSSSQMYLQSVVGLLLLVIVVIAFRRRDAFQAVLENMTNGVLRRIGKEGIGKKSSTIIRKGR